MSSESIISVLQILAGLLLMASIGAVIARRLRIPYTVALVVIGLGFALFFPRQINVLPQVILALLVPPLVFEAAFHIRIEDLRRDIWLIALLAVPGVILTTLMVGGLVSWGTGLPIQAALVFGALVGATDPVAVVALFRQLGAPRRLQVLLEGESLLNDGTAIVMFGLMLNFALQERFDTTTAAAGFLTISGGGLLVGIILGLLASQAIGRIDDPPVETTLTTVLAFGSYLIAESLHVSGVLAVVAAGLVNGNAEPRGMSATTRVVAYNFWEYAAFLANSLIFLLIGLAVDVRLLMANWQAIAWAILAALLARVVSIYGFSVFSRDISTKWKHVLFWGGLRGAIALALALSLPEQGIFASERERLQAMAFGLALFTLLVQGFSMNWLVRRLRLAERTPAQNEYERRHARFVAGRAAYDYLRRRSSEGLISEHTWQRLSPVIQRQNERMVEAIRQVMTSDPTVEAEELDTAQREVLRAQRTALTGLLRDGVITEENFSELVGEVDEALAGDHFLWPELLQAGRPHERISRLMTVIIQESDLPAISSALNRRRFSFTHLSSTGGFLRRGNVTLLIGLSEGREEEAVQTLQSNCKKHLEFQPMPFPDLPGVQSTPVQVYVGGATIFTFEVESWEEF